MEQNYITIMIQSLEEKITVLNRIIELNREQKEILGKEKFLMDDFDKNTDLKADCIQKLNGLDDGFQSIYEHIRDVLQSIEGRKKYESQIMIIQNMITQVTEKSVKIQAQESRNKELVEKIFARERVQIKRSKKGSKAAVDYYRSMNNGNVSMPHFMDEKN